MNSKSDRHFKPGRPSTTMIVAALRRVRFRPQQNNGDIDMQIRTSAPSRIRYGLGAAALLASAILAAPASAGECPAGKVSPGTRTAGEMKPKGVTDTVLAKIDLSAEKVNLRDRELRIRKLIVQPGGVVPWHSHEDRPALIYIVSGTIHEYSSNCSEPIEHKPGEVSVEKLGVQHWWKNNGKTPAVLLSSDVFHDMPQADEHMM
jgi:quercetin dioxygenase-like cupin family protein